MKPEIDNNAMWAAFRQELALQGELQVVAAIDNALNNLGFTIEETSTIISIPLKQGEQKLVDKIQLGKKYKCIASPRYSTFMRDKIYKPEDKFLCSLMNFCSDCFEPIEDGEQKPADKVEPKFHEGDWISGYYTNYKVLSVNDNGYVVEDVDGNKINILFENEKFHSLWNIKNAKDGDVLYSPCCKLLWIYKDEKTCHVGSNLNYNSGNIVINKPICIPTDVQPATKKQREQLEKAMADAGYTFDFDKKELKKIEQKPTDDDIKEVLRTEYEKGRADVIAEIQKERTDDDERNQIQSEAGQGLFLRVGRCADNGRLRVRNARHEDAQCAWCRQVAQGAQNG